MPRSSACGYLRFTSSSVARQSKLAGIAPPLAFGAASDSAIVPGGDIGQSRKSATGRNVSIAPVSSVTISNGDVSMPRSRW